MTPAHNHTANGATSATSADTDSTGPDIVLEVLARVRACTPHLTDEQATQIERDIRTQFGGMRVRIPKRKKHPSDEQRQAIYRDGLTTATDQTIQQTHGISRSTLYRLLKRGTGSTGDGGASK